jgi:hypothetical protein
MKNRLAIVHKVIQANIKDKLPLSVQVGGNLTTEHKLISKILRRMGKNKDIGMSTESGKNLLWFRRRK